MADWKVFVLCHRYMPVIKFFNSELWVFQALLEHDFSFVSYWNWTQQNGNFQPKRKTETGDRYGGLCSRLHISSPTAPSCWQDQSMYMCFAGQCEGTSSCLSSEGFVLCHTWQQRQVFFYAQNTLLASTAWNLAIVCVCVCMRVWVYVCGCECGVAAGRIASLVPSV